MDVDSANSRPWPVTARPWLIGVCLLSFASGCKRKKQRFSSKPKANLTEKDPPFKAVPKGFSKTHTIKLAADKGYRFDLTSKDFDTLLFLTDENGKILAYDDDGGGGTNSRLIFRPTKDGEYGLVVTSPLPAETGKYALVVTAASATDLLYLRARQFPKLDRDERSKFLEELLDHFDALGKKVGPVEANLAMQLGGVMEDSTNTGCRRLLSQGEQSHRCE